MKGQLDIKNINSEQERSLCYIYHLRLCRIKSKRLDFLRHTHCCHVLQAASHNKTDLTEFLPGVKGVSYNTIASKRDTYMLLFKYLKECQNLKPEAVDIPQLSMEVINAFLEWLEITRNSSVSTRNIRLAAIRSLFSYIQMQKPDYIYQCRQILSIPRKKEPEHNIEYLTVDGIKAVLDAVDTFTKQGLRDLAVSPHGLRHSKSMHMLQAGVPLIYIRDFLGHSEISTTEIYARCDSEQKRKAIEAACPSITKADVPLWHSDSTLMEWLQSL